MIDVGKHESQGFDAPVYFERIVTEPQPCVGCEEEVVYIVGPRRAHGGRWLNTPPEGVTLRDGEYALGWLHAHGEFRCRDWRDRQRIRMRKYRAGVRAEVA